MPSNTLLNLVVGVGLMIVSSLLGIAATAQVGNPDIRARASRKVPNPLTFIESTRAHTRSVRIGTLRTSPNSISTPPRSELL